MAKQQMTAEQAQAKADELKQYAQELKADPQAKPEDVREAEKAAEDAQFLANELAEKESESESAKDAAVGKNVVIARELNEARGAEVEKYAKLFPLAAKQIIKDLVGTERGKDAEEKAAKVSAGIGKSIVVVSFSIDEKNKRAVIVADAGNYGRRKAEVSLKK